MKTGNIKCSKCGGKTIVDRIFTKWNYLELNCLNCGKRKIYTDAEKGGEFSRWLINIERELSIKSKGYLRQPSTSTSTTKN